MSPIIDVQHRMVEVGRLRFGEKNQRGLPTKLKTWRLTSPDKTRLDAAAELWGGEVEPWEEQWELKTKASELRIMLLPGQALSQWFELWGQRKAKAPVECLRRCDGRHELFSDGPCKCPRDEDGRMEETDDDVCRPVTRLSVMLPELVGLGHWRMETRGWYAAVELAGSTSILQRATEAGQILPARLRLDERRQVKNGQTIKYMVPVIDVDVTIPELMAGSPRLLPAGEPEPTYTPIEQNGSGEVTVQDGLAAVEKQKQPAKARSARSAAALGPPVDEAASLLGEGSPPIEAPQNLGRDSDGGGSEADPITPAAPAETISDMAEAKINDRQRRMLFATARDCGVDEDRLRELVESVTGEASTRSIQKSQFEGVLAVVRAEDPDVGEK